MIDAGAAFCISDRIGLHSRFLLNLTMRQTYVIHNSRTVNPKRNIESVAASLISFFLKFNTEYYCDILNNYWMRFL